jgi:hypothetical protein
MALEHCRKRRLSPSTPPRAADFKRCGFACESVTVLRSTTGYVAEPECLPLAMAIWVCSPDGQVDADAHVYRCIVVPTATSASSDSDSSASSGEGGIVSASSWRARSNFLCTVNAVISRSNA